MTDRKEILELVAGVTAKGYIAQPCFDRQQQISSVRLHGYKKMTPLAFAEWARPIVATNHNA